MSKKINIKMQRSQASGLKTVGSGAKARYEHIDQILKAINRDIDVYRNQSFEKFGIQVVVTPAEKARPSYNSISDWIGYDEYKFSAINRGLTIMRVKMDAHGEVAIRFNNRWTDAKDYMATLQPAVDMNEPVHGGTDEDTLMKRIGHQSRWWTSNDKTFKITELVPEVRDIIYGFAFPLGDRVEPYPTHKGRRLVGNRAAIAAIRARQPNINLMFASRLLYKEMSHRLFKHATFVVDKFPILRTLIQNPHQRALIRKLELNFSDSDYNSLFGKDVWVTDPSPKYNNKSDPNAGEQVVARDLKGMELDQLTINIKSRPYDYKPTKKSSIGEALDEAWQFIKFHPVKIIGARHIDIADFEEKMALQQSGFESWQMEREEAGEDKGTLRQYCAELEEVELEERELEEETDKLSFGS